FPVILNGECLEIIHHADRCRELAGGVERGIERAIDVVANEGEGIIEAEEIAGARGDDLAVALDGDGSYGVVSRSNPGRQLSGRIERGIQLAIGVVAHENEIGIAAVKTTAGGDDFPVALDG